MKIPPLTGFEITYEHPTHIYSICAEVAAEAQILAVQLMLYNKRQGMADQRILAQISVLSQVSINGKYNPAHLKGPELPQIIADFFGSIF